MSSSLALPAILVCVVATAVSNTIIRRIAMVPMEDYPLFITICQTFVYVIAYGMLLASRIDYDSDERRNKPHNNNGNDSANANGKRPVTLEMLRIRKLPFLWIGLLDSLGDLLGNAAIGKLPGYQPPLLAKLNIVFTAFFSSALLGETYRWKQVGSMVVVVCGSLLTLVPLVRDAVRSGDGAHRNDGDGGGGGGGGGDDSSDPNHSLTQLFYVVVYVSSVAPTALGFILKERIFREYEALFDLDIFVVNTYTSIGGLLCQAVFFVPLAALSGVPYANISGYMTDAYRCFTHDLVAYDATDETGLSSSLLSPPSCHGSPVAPVLYLAINILYNICFLLSIKHGGTLLTFITNTVTFPLSTLLFACGIPWPLLGTSTRLNFWILAGLSVEVTGIVWYYSEKTRGGGSGGGGGSGSGGDVGNGHERSPLVPKHQRANRSNGVDDNDESAPPLRSAKASGKHALG